MKKLHSFFSAAASLLIVVRVFSQPVCESFDGFAVPNANKAHAFNIYGNGNPGFLSSWFVPSGTPSVYASGDISGVNAYDGNQYAFAGVCDVSTTSADGLEYQHSFQQGQSYRLSMMARNHPIGAVANNPIDVDFVLLPSLIPYVYNTGTGCSALPAIPLGGQVVYTLSNFTADSWQLISFNTGVLTGNYSYLWMRPHFSAGAALSSELFCIDSFCANHIVCSTSPVVTADDSLICSSDTAHICVPGGFTAYHWNNGATSPCIGATLAGNYYVTVTDTSGCTVESSHFNLAVYPHPPVSITINGDTLKVYNALTQQWYLNGQAISGATADTYIAPQPGSYSVAVTDSNGCVSESSPVNISAIEKLKETEGGVEIYPNPLSNEGQVVVKSTASEPLSARVYDIIGKLIMENKHAEPNKELPLGAEISSGMYFIEITQGAFRKTIRLVKSE